MQIAFGIKFQMLIEKYHAFYSSSSSSSSSFVETKVFKDQIEQIDQIEQVSGGIRYNSRAAWKWNTILSGTGLFVIFWI